MQPLEAEPRRPALRALGLIVISRRLLDGAVLRLLHCLLQGDALSRGFREIARPQTVRCELPWIELSQATAPLDDEIDGLGRERPFLQCFPAVDRAKDRPLMNIGSREPFPEGVDRLSHSI